MSAANTGAMTRRERAAFKLSAHQLGSADDLIEAWKKYDVRSDQSVLLAAIIGKRGLDMAPICLPAI